MKRFLFLSLFLLLWSIPGNAAIAVVQVKAGNTTTGNTCPVTVTATGAGNLLIMGVNSVGSFTVTGASDGTSAFTQVSGAQYTHAAAAMGSGDVWYLPSSNAGKTTITATFSGSPGFQDCIVWEVSGIPSPVVDQRAVVNNGPNVAGNLTGASVTTSGVGFIIGMMMTGGGTNGGNNPLSGNAFTSGGIVTGFSDGGVSLITSGGGTYNPAWGDPGGTPGVTDFGNATVAFKASGGGVTSVASKKRKLGKLGVVQ